MSDGLSSSLTVKLDISVDVNELLRQISSLTHRTSRTDVRFDNGNGRWVEGQQDGILFSCSYHKTKSHSATVEVHNRFQQVFQAPDKIVRSSKSTAPPGTWAIAYCNSGRLGGDKTYYDFW